MANISQHLPEQTKTVAAIFAHYKKVGDAEPVRGYLGASIIGHLCERYLWYCFRQCCKPDFSGRMYRLFHTGDLEEDRLVNDLRMIGCEVHNCDQDGEQFEVSALGGHFSGHMDGCALGIPEAPKTWHVCEFKTHNAKSFIKLKREGVQKSKPQHYAQVMVYMHLTGMRRALYLAQNKDTDDLYSERIRYNKIEAEALMDRAWQIIVGSTLPERIASRADDYRCNYCDAQLICWGGGNNDPILSIPSLSCRQCCHATPQIDGSDDRQWKCEKYGTLITTKDPCDNHLVLPGLISFAEPTDYGQSEDGKNFIEFTNEDGFKWKHGSTPGAYSSEELRKLPANVIGRPIINTAKKLFMTTITECQEDILQRYPTGSEHTVFSWRGPAEELFKIWKKQYKEELMELTPITRCNFVGEYYVTELEGARVVIFWVEDEIAEIREVVPF